MHWVRPGEQKESRDKLPSKIKPCKCKHFTHNKIRPIRLGNAKRARNKSRPQSLILREKAIYSEPRHTVRSREFGRKEREHLEAGRELGLVQSAELLEIG